ncbi:MAG: alpha/beta fold hydrolase [Parvularculaceae bacterium]|nr:alpha/beta fold hydrolase [Parvularculaceae bacterium]
MTRRLIAAGLAFVASTCLTIDAALAQADDLAGDGAAGEAAGEAPAPDDDLFARDSFSVTPIICPFKGQFDYKPGEISCGLITVPENRERPRSRKIQLHYVKLAARKPARWDEAKDGEWKKREDPIIYLTGGPGVAVTGYALRLKDHGARDVRDMYILEQRGVGYSGDYCPLYSNVDPAATNVHTWEEYLAARMKPIEACFAAAKARGVDLSAYNSIENARDVHALRRALGIEKWNVWGISYGSILGQAYIKEDPEGVRAAVLDAIVPLVQGAHFQTVGTFLQRDLDLLEKACATSAVCKAHFPDLDGRLEAAMLAVRKEPIKLKALDPELAPTGEVTIFDDIVPALPFQMLYEQKNYGSIPAFIEAFAALIERRDFEGLRALTASGGPGGVDVSQGMYNAIMCNDGWAFDLARAIEQDLAAEPVFGRMQGSPEVGEAIAKVCRKYGMDPRPAEQYAPVETDLRIVIANGEMDPITPPMLAKSILPGLSNATYVEFPYAGHGPTRSVKCGGAFVTKFFDNPDGELDRSCADDMKPPEFVGPLFETQAPLRIATAIAETPPMALALGLWIGLPAFFLVFGAINYVMAPASRLIDGAKSLREAGVRPLAWLTAATGAASALGLAAAVGASAAANEFLLIVGLLGWAKGYAAAGLVSAALGVVLFVSTILNRGREHRSPGVISGLMVTSLSAVALGAFLARWDLLPF